MINGTNDYGDLLFETIGYLPCGQALENDVLKIEQAYLFHIPNPRYLWSLIKENLAFVMTAYILTV